MDREQTNRFLSKQPREKVAALKNPKTIKKFIRIFNNLCRDCRAKAMKFPSMKYGEYCQDCRKMIDKIGGK